MKNTLNIKIIGLLLSLFTFFGCNKNGKEELTDLQLLFGQWIENPLFPSHQRIVYPDGAEIDTLLHDSLLVTLNSDFTYTTEYTPYISVPIFQKGTWEFDEVERKINFYRIPEPNEWLFPTHQFNSFQIENLTEDEMTVWHYSEYANSIEPDTNRVTYLQVFSKR